MFCRAVLQEGDVRSSLLMAIERTHELGMISCVLGSGIQLFPGQADACFWWHFQWRVHLLYASMQFIFSSVKVAEWPPFRKAARSFD